jgi:hypothetical protein
MSDSSITKFGTINFGQPQATTPIPQETTTSMHSTVVPTMTQGVVGQTTTSLADTTQNPAPLGDHETGTYNLSNIISALNQGAQTSSGSNFISSVQAPSPSTPSQQTMTTSTTTDQSDVEITSNSEGSSSILSFLNDPTNQRITPLTGPSVANLTQAAVQIPQEPSNEEVKPDHSQVLTESQPTDQLLNKTASFVDTVAVDTNDIQSQTTENSTSSKALEDSMKIEELHLRFQELGKGLVAEEQVKETMERLFGLKPRIEKRK